MQIAGKVVPLTKGDYDATITYNHLDWVRHDGATWCCKKDNIVGVEPTEGETWTLIAKDGENGQDGDKGDVGEGLTATSSKVGKITTVTLKAATSGTVVDTFTVLDGADGNGSGNMHTDTYDPTQSGIVNSARVLSNGTDVINMTDVLKKPISATDGQFIKYNGTNWVAGDGASDWNSVQSKPFKTVGDGLKVESEELKADVSWTNVKSKPFATVGTDFKTDSDTLALADTITKRLATIDENITDGFLRKNLLSNDVDDWIQGTPTYSTQTRISNKKLSVRHEDITFSCISGYLIIMAWLYKGDTQVGMYGKNGTTDNNDTNVLTVSTTIDYDGIIVAIKPSDDSNIPLSALSTIKPQAEYGSVATSYVPYAKSNVELTRAIDDNVADGFLQKNLFDGTLYNGNFTDANFNMEMTTSNVYVSCKLYLEKGTYTFSCAKNINVVRVVKDGVYSSSGVSGQNSFSFTCTTDGYVGFSWRDATSSSTVWDKSTHVQIEKGSQATDYVPFAKSNVELTSTLDNLTEEIATLVKAKIITYESHTFANGTSVYTPSALPSGVPTSGTIVGILFGGSITFDNMYIQWNGGESQSVNSVNTYRCNVNNMRGSSVTTQLKATVFYI